MGFVISSKKSHKRMSSVLLLHPLVGGFARKQHQHTQQLFNSDNDDNDNDDPTNSTVSSEDSNSFNQSIEQLLPVWSNGQEDGGNGQEDGHKESSRNRPTMAYNFDQYSSEEDADKEIAKNSNKQNKMMIETTTPPLQILDQQSYVKLAALSSVSCSPQASRPMVSYRWNTEDDISSLAAESNGTDQTQDVFRPFFTFATRSDDGDENMEYSDSASLLHGDRQANKVVSRPSVTSTSCLTPLTTRIPFRKKKDTEGSASLLMHENTTLCNDWSERQLAFDLEVVEDDPTLDNDPFSSSWMMCHHHQPKDIVIQESQVVIGNSWYLLPHALMPLTPGAPKSPELKIQHTMYDGLIRGGRSSISSSHGNGNGCSDGSISSSTTGSCSRRRKTSQHHQHHKLKGSESPHHRRGSSSQTGTTGSQYQTKSRKSSSRRRGSPVLLGRQFSPNLSTVPERPSEEDASYSLTPRNDSAATTPAMWSL